MDLHVHVKPHCKATLESLCLHRCCMHLTFRSTSHSPVCCSKLNSSAILSPMQELIDLELTDLLISISTGSDNSSTQNGK